MDEIKENGVVRWKGLITVIGGLVLSIFLYLDNKLLSKAQFQEFKTHVLIHLQDIKNELRYKARDTPGA